MFSFKLVLLGVLVIAVSAIRAATSETKSSEDLAALESRYGSGYGHGYYGNGYYGGVNAGYYNGYGSGYYGNNYGGYGNYYRPYNYYNGYYRR